MLKTTPASINLVNWAAVGKLISVTYENLILYPNTLSYVSFSCNYMCITGFAQTLQTHTPFQCVSSLVYFLSCALFPDLFNSELISEDCIALTIEPVVLYMCCFSKRSCLVLHFGTWAFNTFVY